MMLPKFLKKKLIALVIYLFIISELTYAKEECTDEKCKSCGTGDKLNICIDCENGYGVDLGWEDDRITCTKCPETCQRCITDFKLGSEEEKITNCLECKNGLDYNFETRNCASIVIKFYFFLLLLPLIF